MAYYAYQGRNRVGKLVKGKVKAESRKEAVQTIKQKGVATTSLTEIQSVLYKELSFGQKVKPKDFVVYLRQFATLINAGISLLETTRILQEQTNSKFLKSALGDIAQQLEGGIAFSDAAEQHSKIFSTLFVNMVRAGEAGGNLEEVLERLAVYYEKQYDTRQKVISTLTYPAIVGVIAIIIVTFLLTFVVPRFANMFANMGGELPLITQVTLQLSHLIQHVWYLGLLVPILAIFLHQTASRSPGFTSAMDQAKLRIPVFGPLLLKASLVRMTNTLSSLMSSSVPILQSLHITQKVVENKVIEQAIEDSYHALERGESLSEPLKKQWIFPPLVVQMIAVGEQTGSLDYMLAKVAGFYESELDYTTDRLKTMIEPIMILCLAIVVGGIVAAIAIPMFSIFEQVN
ncbi:type II secretion system F family protein [Thalassobacillus sp. CUG 92003]|uniref:type II secretion system F family protein n=1 Tax=Thalassobacillus sp. CUG 92003 TaxID=2736641 RepID=UPI0015E790C4|nr:type II secretion system F family protein [Thalassobacillus sp. CUG 92003]